MSIEPLGPGSGIWVELSWNEVLLAAYAGTMRRVNAVKYGRRESFRDAERSRIWGGDIDGCIGEMAVAKHFNVYWNATIGRVDLPDVGRYQVRTRENRPDRDLIICPTDKDDEVFILVLASPPRCHLVGWILAGDGKRQEWLAPERLKFPEPAYLVPRKALHPVQVLPNPSVGRQRSRPAA